MKRNKITTKRTLEQQIKSKEIIITKNDTSNRTDSAFGTPNWCKKVSLNSRAILELEQRAQRNLKLLRHRPMKHQSGSPTGRSLQDCANKGDVREQMTLRKYAESTNICRQCGQPHRIMTTPKKQKGHIELRKTRIMESRWHDCERM